VKNHSKKLQNIATINVNDFLVRTTAGAVAGVIAGIFARVAMRGVALVASLNTDFTPGGTLAILVIFGILGIPFS
jgi:hypothetical protein